MEGITPSRFLCAASRPSPSVFDERSQLAGMDKTDSLFRLDGQVPVVAGAASGIGRASAVGLARAGATVVCADIDLEGAEKVAAEIGGESVALDILDEAAVETVVAGIIDKHRRIDVLVSTPAVNVRKPLLNYTVRRADGRGAECLARRRCTGRHGRAASRASDRRCRGWR
jgi:NAD(P)-dependent dehydrogenase (short-subunit alcohol dehydrogenase family)